MPDAARHVEGRQSAAAELSQLTCSAAARSDNEDAHPSDSQQGTGRRRRRARRAARPAINCERHLRRDRQACSGFADSQYEAGVNRTRAIRAGRSCLLCGDAEINQPPLPAAVGID